jgi:GT2 family glycosyltransferase
VTEPGRIRLVVLTHNGGDNVVRCFEHLHRLQWSADDLELVLIDNASRDGSAAQVVQRFPAVHVITMAHNEGFPANNVALTDLTGIRYVGLVNDDAFVTPDYLSPLVEALDSAPDVAAACPKMLFAAQYLEVTLETTAFRPGRGDPRALGIRISGLRVDGEDRWRRAHLAFGGYGREHTARGAHEWTGDHAVLRVPVTREQSTVPEVEICLSAVEPRHLRTRSGMAVKDLAVTTEPRWYVVPVEGMPFDVINNAGSAVLSDGYGIDRGFGQRDDGRFDEPDEVFAWCGGAVLLRPEYLADVGLFDERFFLYYEDTDLSWRGQGRGWRYRYVPDAVIHHLHASTTVEGSGRFAYFTERNRLMMLAKNAPADMVDAALKRYLSGIYDAVRRDVAGALVQGRRPNPIPALRRARALLGYARRTPGTLLARAEVRPRQLVADDDLLERLTVG